MFLSIGYAYAVRSLSRAESEVSRLAAFSNASGRIESRSADVLANGDAVCIQ